MRLSDYFPESSISVIHSAKDWQEAIDFSMVSLLDKNYISENYNQAIKDSTINNGPYYILAPGVAMPHARPECGALKTGMSLTLLEQGVYFPGMTNQLNYSSDSLLPMPIRTLALFRR